MLDHNTEKAQWEGLLFSSNSFLLWEGQSTIMISVCRQRYKKGLGLEVCSWYPLLSSVTFFAVLQLHSTQHCEFNSPVTV